MVIPCHYSFTLEILNRVIKRFAATVHSNQRGKKLTYWSIFCWESLELASFVRDTSIISRLIRRQVFLYASLGSFRALPNLKSRNWLSALLFLAKMHRQIAAIQLTCTLRYETNSEKERKTFSPTSPSSILCQPNNKFSFWRQFLSSSQAWREISTFGRVLELLEIVETWKYKMLLIPENYSFLKLRKWN